MTKKQVEKKQENYAAPIICAIVIVIALLAVVIATVASINTDKNNTKKDDNQSFVDDDDTPDYSVLSAIDNQDVLDMFADKKSGFVYIGRPTCSSCKVFAPILTKVVKAEKYDIFYYDTDAANEDKELKAEALDKLNVTGVPTFMYIRDGVEVERLEDTRSEEALREFIEKYL